jgi:hypothetical protein
MNGYGGPYTTKAAIIDFISTIQSDIIITVNDISDVVLASTTEQINYKTDTAWQVYAGILYIDGNGERSIFSPLVPIVTLTELAIIGKDTTEEKLILTGINRQVWWNNETGCISRLDWDKSHIEVDPLWGEYFIEGQNNIRLTGTFGRATFANTLALLQQLMVFKILTFKFPDLKTDMIMEKIGEYQYRIGEGAKNSVNEKRTLDGYIDYLFSCLPKDDKLCVVAI